MAYRQNERGLNCTYHRWDRSRVDVDTNGLLFTLPLRVAKQRGTGYTAQKRSLLDLQIVPAMVWKVLGVAIKAVAGTGHVKPSRSREAPSELASESVIVL